MKCGRERWGEGKLWHVWWHVTRGKHIAAPHCSSQPVIWLVYQCRVTLACARYELIYSAWRLSLLLTNVSFFPSVGLFFPLIFFLSALFIMVNCSVCAACLSGHRVLPFSQQEKLVPISILSCETDQILMKKQVCQFQQLSSRAGGSW